MAKQERYSVLADSVLNPVGGKDNIEFFIATMILYKDKKEV
jgi:hypothetical protein